MSQDYPNMNDEHVRKAILFVVDSQWGSLRNKIRDLKNRLIPMIGSNSAQSLESSYLTLEDTITSLTGNKTYKEKEVPTDYRRYIQGIDNALKDFFTAFGLCNSSDTNLRSIDDKDNVFASTMQMYETLSSIHDRRLFHVYPAVTRIITYLRNTQTHNPHSKETVHRVPLAPLDNIHSLSCIMILTMYAYIELLELWLTTSTGFSRKK